MTNLTRRHVMAGLVTLPVLTGGAAQALTDAEAMALVQRMADDITTTINSGKADAAMFRDFERLLERYADMNIIARSSLGPAARSVNGRDFNRYQAAFQTYVSKKYGARFREFIGGELEVRRAREVGRATVVDTRARLRGQSPIAVEFHVSDRSGSAKVFNVVIEGINLLTTERTEITTLLDQQGGSISALTEELKRRS
ncbi:MAG: ABC transporter substrate-binding protein [Pseudomonadota bacterium]